METNTCKRMAAIRCKYSKGCFWHFIFYSFSRWISWQSKRFGFHTEIVLNQLAITKRFMFSSLFFSISFSLFQSFVCSFVDSHPALVQIHEHSVSFCCGICIPMESIDGYISFSFTIQCPDHFSLFLLPARPALALAHWDCLFRILVAFNEFR